MSRLACPVPKKFPKLPKKPPRKRKPARSPPKRPKQHRRKDYEDGGGIDDDGIANAIPEPALFRPTPTQHVPGSPKVAVVALRHHLRAQLWHEDDPPIEGQADHVQHLSDLALFMRAVVLGDRCGRWVADGISIVPGPKAGDPPQYRAQIWDPGLGKKGDHIELGYAKTREEAVDLIACWLKRHCRVDTYVEIPEWLMTCMGYAIKVQAEYSEAHGGMAWGVT